MEVKTFKKGINMGMPTTNRSSFKLELPIYMDYFINKVEHNLDQEVINRLQEVCEKESKDFKTYQNKSDLGVRFIFSRSSGEYTYRGKVNHYECYCLYVNYGSEIPLYYDTMYMFMNKIRTVCSKTIQEFKPKDYKQIHKRNVTFSYDEHRPIKGNREYKGSKLDQLVNKKELPF